MALNDPPIQLSMEPWIVRRSKQQLHEKYDFWMYNKSDYYCIDGFPQDGFPCVVVLPPPFRSGYVYQGIKPAILPVEDCSDEILDHVRHKQEELLEKLKVKRQQTLDQESASDQKIEVPIKIEVVESLADVSDIQDIEIEVAACDITVTQSKIKSSPEELLQVPPSSDIIVEEAVNQGGPIIESIILDEVDFQIVEVVAEGQEEHNNEEKLSTDEIPVLSLHLYSNESSQQQVVEERQSPK